MVWLHIVEGIEGQEMNRTPIFHKLIHLIHGGQHSPLLRGHCCGTVDSTAPITLSSHLSVPVRVPAVQLEIQLPANASGNAIDVLGPLPPMWETW